MTFKNKLTKNIKFKSNAENSSFINNYSHNFNNIILQRELTLTTKRKLSFERCNFSIKKDLSFDQTKDSTLEDLTISDTIFTEETFSIFIKALSECSASKSLKVINLFRLGIQKESITEIMQIIDVPVHFL